MRKNMGNADRYLRSILAFGLFALIVTGLVGGALAWALGIIGAILLATSFVGFCPLYAPFHFSTRRGTT